MLDLWISSISLSERISNLPFIGFADCFPAARFLGELRFSVFVGDFFEEAYVSFNRAWKIWEIIFLVWSVEVIFG